MPYIWYLYVVETVKNMFLGEFPSLSGKTSKNRQFIPIEM